MGVSAFAFIPLSWLSIAEERFVRKPFPVDAVAAHRHSYLLGFVVVGSCVEHVHALPAHSYRGSFDALALPGQLRSQYGAVGHLRPLASAEVCASRRSGYSHLLHLEVRVACSEIKEVLAAEEAHFSIDGPSAGPVSCGCEDGVAAVAHEVDAVGGSCVADGILAPVAVGLVEQMHHSITHQSAGCAESVLLIVGSWLRCNLSHLVPQREVMAFGYAYVPAVSHVAFAWRDGVVHQVAALQAHHMRVLGKGHPLA